MRKRIRRSDTRGFAFLAMLFTVTGALAFSVVGLTRAVNQTTLATRTVTQLRQFQAAEGALDAALKDGQLQAPLTQADVDRLVSTYAFNGGAGTPLITGSLENGAYTYNVWIDDPDASSNAMVGLVVRSTITGSTQPAKEVRATVELPVAQALPPGPFDYAAAVTRFESGGNTVLGHGAIDGSGRVPIYAAYINAGPSDTVYASWIGFDDKYGTDIQTLCPKCNDISIFPNLPDGSRPPMQAPAPQQLTSFFVDPSLYYAQAIAQCVAQGNTQANCVSGAANSYHHITSSQTITGGQSSPLVLQGVIYVEAGVSLDFARQVKINGTIFHEGLALQQNADGTVTPIQGGIGFKGGSSVWIDSFASTDINSDGTPEAPFAPGLAVGGGARFDWNNRATLGDGSLTIPGIKGYVMGYSQGGSWGAVAAEGTIEGGLVGATHYSGSTDTSWNPSEPPSCMGPCSVVTPWRFDLNQLNLGGSAMLHILFKPLEQNLPGFSNAWSGGSGGTSNVTRPTVKYWTVN